jgi:apolipoprotein N-acyltransferase
VDYSRFKMPAFQSVPRRDYLLAAFSGVLLALSFPKAGWSFLAWVAFVPLFLACGRKSARKAAKLGFAAGLVSFGGILYWINIVVTTYGKLPLAVSICVYMILVTYLALFSGVVFYLVRRGEEKGIPVVVSFPFVWVGLEYVRSFLFTGFPWASLGYSQYRLLPLIQIADIAGVYGISFLIALANVVLYLFLKGFTKKDEEGGYPVRSAAVFLLLLVSALAYGFHGMSRPASGTPLKVSLVQGNIDQGIKWDPAFLEATLTIYEKLTRQAAGGGVDLVVWPESAAPFFFQEGGEPSSRITALAGQVKSPIVFGSPAYEDGVGRRTFFNSAYLVSPSGAILGRSDKMHLVPFGEYVPLAKLLPFVHKLVAGVGDFSPGHAITPLEPGKGSIGVLVCFEGIFPELSRRYVRSGARILVNITNDAWYGRSSAPYQHLSMAVFRAIENRVPLLRAANTGITAIIDENGRITSKTRLFEEAFLNGEVRPGTGGTLYTRVGDVFAILCLAVTALVAVAGFRKLPARWGRDSQKKKRSK